MAPEIMRYNGEQEYTEKVSEYTIECPSAAVITVIRDSGGLLLVCDVPVRVDQSEVAV